jgi:molybdopterin biosynthesis enzyme
MRRLSALLVLLMVVTGLGQALAQGRMAGARGVELCTDAGAATVLVDASGNPVAAAHDCADCLLPVLAAAQAVPAPQRPAAAARTAALPAATPRRGTGAPPPQARGPPVTTG